MNTVNKLLIALGYNTQLHYDKWSVEHQFVAGKRKWVAEIMPVEVLERSLKKAVESLVTLNQSEIF